MYQILLDEHITTSQDWLIIGSGAMILFVIVVWSVVILTIMEKYDDKSQS